jgi:two-component system, NarL family, sensor histidine kinase DesK
MTGIESNPKRRLAMLSGFGGCAAILVISYHVINQRVLSGGFDSRDVPGDSGWTWPTLQIALLSAAYFLVACLSLYCDFRKRDEAHDGFRKSLAHHLLVTQGILLFGLLIFSPESSAVFAALYLPRVRNLRSLRVALLIFAMVVLFLVASLVYYYEDALGVTGVAIVAVLAAAFYLFALMHAHNAIVEKELRQQAAQLNSELVATREQLAQSTRQSERLRISRNLHDLLGHQLTGLILSLELAGHITEGEVNARVRKSLELAKSLLADLRSAVTEMRESTFFDFNRALHDIIVDIPELKVSLSMAEGLIIGNAKTAEALVRCIQEALTNVRRHARATQCGIAIFRRNGQVVMQIKDNGTATGEFHPGNGLAGMRERIVDLSGQCSWGRTADGFCVEAVLPLGVM